jgi:hypothetical protein
MTMIDAVELLGLTQPDYIKIDVDGIEHLIHAITHNSDGLPSLIAL